MDSIARELCSAYSDEAWRIGFVAGLALSVWIAVAVAGVRRLIRSLKRKEVSHVE